MTLRDLFLRVRALIAPRRVDHELDEELAFHIEYDTQKHLANGLSHADARARALTRFGAVSLVADRCRDVRGTAVIDNLARDIVYAFRTLHRAPLAACTIVATIALGLGLVAAVFTFFHAFLRADAVENPSELFGVVRSTGPGADSSVPFTHAEYDALRRETDVFSDVAAIGRSTETRLDGHPVRGTLVTGNFFHVLGVQALLGRTLTPADDELSTGRPIVLSHRAWIKLFAGDPTVINRKVSVNGVPCEIAGVMPKDFDDLVGPRNYWAPLALDELRQSHPGREDELLVDIVGRLKPGISSDQAAAALSVWASGRATLSALAGGGKAAGNHPVAVRLKPRQRTLADWLEGLALFSPIFVAFGLILMIGCANVANLLFARGVSRQREIGIRLSLGASRRRVVRQLLTESLMLALAAAACGFAVSRISLRGALYAASTTMPPQFAEAVDLGVPSADWRVLVFLMAGAVVSTVSFGLVPALQATRVELVRASRGEVTRDARPSRARHALIAVQVGASALLLICAAVFLRSAFAAAIADPGIRTTDTITVPIANESRRAAIVREVTAHPSVIAVAAEAPPVLASVFAEATADKQAGVSPEIRRSVSIDYRFVSPEYFQLLDIDVTRGRGFTDAEPTTDAGVTVVSEGAARKLWPNSDALGQVLRIQENRATDLQRPSDSPSPSRAYTVVGIARDVPGSAIVPFFAFSGVYLPIDPQRPGTSLMLRVRGDPERARLALLNRLLRVDLNRTGFVGGPIR